MRLGFLMIFFVWWTAPAAYGQEAPPDCSTPRSAADSLFAWQQPDRFDPSRAKACLDVPPGANGERLAVQLKQVLDARALYVPVSTLSTDPDYLENGEHQVVPIASFPALVLERGADGRWRYSRRTLEAVPGLYRDTFSPLSLWFQSQLPALFYQRALGLHLWQYLYALLLLAAAWGAGQGVRLLLRGQVRRMVRRAGLQLDDGAYRRTNGPIVLLVVFGVLWWGLTDLQLDISLSVWFSRLLRIAVWLSALLAISRFINVGAAVARSWADSSESRLDDQLIPLVRQASQVLLFVLGGLYVADALGLDVWKLAASVGIGGLAFALAAQDTVKNLFGSVNIFVDRPFQIGDAITIQGVEGVVEEVGFRSTRIRTFYNSVVTIPNSALTNANIDNLGLRNRRRAKYTLGLTYDTSPDKVQAFVQGVRGILEAHPAVVPGHEVHCSNLGNSAIEIMVYYHLEVPGWHEELIAKSQNILEILRLAESLGAEFAFPSQSLYLESTPEHPLQPHPPAAFAELETVAASFGPGGERSRPGGPSTRAS